jgi:hypothetical protein
MKQTLISILTLIGFSSFGQNDYDYSRIAIIHLDSLRNWTWNLEFNKPTILTDHQVLLADSIVRISVSKHNKEIEQRTILANYINVKPFIMQLVPTVNNKGDVIVWANCFCEDFLPWLNPEYRNKKQERKFYSPPFHWKEEIVEVHDGGGCFFNVTVNLTTREYFNLSVNGI